jgi:hypothetical protein
MLRHLAGFAGALVLASVAVAVALGVAVGVGVLWIEPVLMPALRPILGGSDVLAGAVGGLLASALGVAIFRRLSAR